MYGRTIALALIALCWCRATSEAQDRSHSARSTSGTDVQQQGQHEDNGDCSASPKSGARNETHSKSSEQRKQSSDTRKGSCAKPPVAPPPAPPPAGLAQIQGTLFDDANLNGILDPGEALSGWTVQLTGTVSATTTTDANGGYSFVSLPIGSYMVCVVPQGTLKVVSPSSGPVCASGFGWTLDVPAALADLWYTGIDFIFTP